MNFSFTGGTEQQIRWFEDALAQCSYPFNAFVDADVVVRWDHPPQTEDSHHPYMVTQVAGVTSFEIFIEPWADDHTNPHMRGLPDPAADTYEFYKQSVVHEIGHVVCFLTFDPLDAGVDPRVATLCAAVWKATQSSGTGRRFGTLHDYDASDLSWPDEVREAAAEFFKCTFFTGRLIFSNRSNWNIDEEMWGTYLDLISPPSQIHETFVNPLPTPDIDTGSPKLCIWDSYDNALSIIATGGGGETDPNVEIDLGVGLVMPFQREDIAFGVNGSVQLISTALVPKPRLLATRIVTPYETIESGDLIIEVTHQLLGFDIVDGVAVSTGGVGGAMTLQPGAGTENGLILISAGSLNTEGQAANGFVESGPQGFGNPVVDIIDGQIEVVDGSIDHLFNFIPSAFWMIVRVPDDPSISVFRFELWWTVDPFEFPGGAPDFAVEVPLTWDRSSSAFSETTVLVSESGVGIDLQIPDWRFYGEGELASPWPFAPRYGSMDIGPAARGNLRVGQ